MSIKQVEFIENFSIKPQAQMASLVNCKHLSKIHCHFYTNSSEKKYKHHLQYFMILV